MGLGERTKRAIEYLHAADYMEEQGAKKGNW